MKTFAALIYVFWIGIISGWADYRGVLDGLSQEEVIEICAPCASGGGDLTTCMECNSYAASMGYGESGSSSYSSSASSLPSFDLSELEGMSEDEVSDYCAPCYLETAGENNMTCGVCGARYESMGTQWAPVPDLEVLTVDFCLDTCWGNTAPTLEEDPGRQCGNCQPDIFLLDHTIRFDEMLRFIEALSSVNFNLPGVSTNSHQDGTGSFLMEDSTIGVRTEIIMPVDANFTFRNHLTAGEIVYQTDDILVEANFDLTGQTFWVAATVGGVRYASFLPFQTTTLLSPKGVLDIDMTLPTSIGDVFYDIHIAPTNSARPISAKISDGQGEEYVVQIPEGASSGEINLLDQEIIGQIDLEEASFLQSYCENCANNPDITDTPSCQEMCPTDKSKRFLRALQEFNQLQSLFTSDRAFVAFERETESGGIVTDTESISRIEITPDSQNGASFEETVNVNGERQLTLLEGSADIVIDGESQPMVIGEAQPLETQTLEKSNFTNLDDTFTNRTLQLSAGWNLISLPMEDEEAKAKILQNAQKIYTYTNETWITNPTDLEKYQGIWVKLDGELSVPFSGTLYGLDSALLQSGWNLLGASFILEDLRMTEGALFSYVYHREKGWIRNPHEIYSGQGFWVKFP